MLSYIQKKHAGYMKLFRHQLFLRKAERNHKKSNALFDQWLVKIEQNEPQVYIGANSPFGGIRNHILSIKKYSQLRTELVADEETFTDLKDFNVVTPRLLQFTPKCLAIHSHVAPWMIDWGKAAQENGIRWVHTYHRNYFFEHGEADVELKPWQQKINNALLNTARHADICLSITRWQQEVFQNEHNIKTYYLPNGVDVQNCDKGNAKRFIQKTRKRDFVLFVGRDDPVKNPQEFIKLASINPQLSFVMIGQGLTQSWQQKILGNETLNNLYCHGSEKHSGVQDAIAACRALVVTSHREGLPTLVLEALTLSKPIVVPDDAGCREAIDEGRLGYIYEPGNTKDLSTQLHKAITDTEKYTHGRAHVLKNYDWRKLAQQLDFIYSEPDLDIIKHKLELSAIGENQS